ncbi:MAG: hypothetical protein NZ651_05775 [Candidatus Bipolaricaulota bacterium]|nr:hypothetical protein [Candidatus Bipolaricaulota bacterium]MDW8127263.1 hypothetical protein [Candidatus Bipolaricaulota bacterium]
MRIILALVVLGVGVWAQEPLGIGGGGFMPVFLFPNLQELNEELSQAGFGEFDSPLVLWGGCGFGGFLTGSRFGGMGYGGDITVSSGEKSAQLSLGVGGFVMEQGLVAQERAALSLGLMIGGGSAELLLVFHKPSSFGEALATPASTSLSRGFFALQPYVSAELFLLDWMFVKVNVGYLFSWGDPWEISGTAVAGPPGQLSAMVFQVFIVFGGKAPVEEPAGE